MGVRTTQQAGSPDNICKKLSLKPADTSPDIRKKPDRISKELAGREKPVPKGRNKLAQDASPG